MEEYLTFTQFIVSKFWKWIFSCFLHSAISYVYDLMVKKNHEKQIISQVSFEVREKKWRVKINGRMAGGGNL